MATVVTLDIFSGRPNPIWTLSASQEKELADRMAALKEFTDKRPSGAFGGLGYRGFLIARNAEESGRADHMHVHEGIVERGLGSPNQVADAALENWLASTADGVIGADLRQHLADAIRNAAAKGFVAKAATSVSCPANHAADAPAYNPGAWNVPNVQPYNNCYNYANDHATNTFAQPGRATGHGTNIMACNTVMPAAVSDGLRSVANFGGTLNKGQGWYVALVVAPGQDYHWYRQDNVGCWSHKPGRTVARNVDNSGHAISDPQHCDRGVYTDFCGYMVTTRGVHIN